MRSLFLETEGICEYSRGISGRVPQMTVGLSKTAILIVFRGYLIQKLKTGYLRYVQDILPLDGFSVIPKCMTLND